MFVIDLVVDVALWLWVIIAGDRVTRTRGSLEQMERRFPRSTVRRAQVVLDWMDTPQLRSVEFVVANSRYLSLRDGHAHEELHAPTAGIAEIRVVSGPGDRGQHVRIVGPDGTIVAELWSPDEIAEPLRSALGASA